MNTEPYLDLAKRHLADCEKYGISIEDATFEIMHMAENYGNKEVKETFKTLPSNVLDLAHSKLEIFKNSGEYHVISSTGVSKDLTNIMMRLSKLI